MLPAPRCPWPRAGGACWWVTVGDRGGRPQVLEDGHQWWKLRSRSGQAGYVPHNILDEIRAEEAGAPHEVR